MSEFSKPTSSFVQDLGEAARKNPLSAALIGMGVLWLFTGGRPVQRAGEFAERTGLGRIPGTAADGFEAARSSLKSGADSIGERVASAKDAVRERSADAFDRAERLAEPALDYARSIPDVGAEMFDTARSNLTEVFRAQPLALGAIGLAIGAGIAAALPPSKIEAAYLGETSDAAKAQASKFTAEQAERATKVAENVVGAVAAEARNQGLTLEGAKSAANEISAKVGRVVDAAGGAKRAKPTVS